jgi:hypothetical protein
MGFMAGAMELVEAWVRRGLFMSKLTGTGFKNALLRNGASEKYQSLPWLGIEIQRGS